MALMLDRLRIVFRGDLRMSGRKYRAQRYLQIITSVIKMKTENPR